MSLKIIKKGLLDTIQDGGRQGYRTLGIRPCGAMDRFSASMANALLGKDLDAAVIEMHFPAPLIQFSEPAIFVLTGADLAPEINGQRIPLGQPVHVAANSTLRFARPAAGQRTYLSTYPGFRLDPWLGSVSADRGAGLSGITGRPLATGDEIHLDSGLFSPKKELAFLNWNLKQELRTGKIRILPGPEWKMLTEESRSALNSESFTISNLSDRMGYRLEGKPLAVGSDEELVSSAVDAGTIQRLPNGQLVVLMADHPTTGGYPRVAGVATADLSRLGQMGAGSSIEFAMVSQAEAENLYLSQLLFLQQLKDIGMKEMNKFLKGR